MQLVVAALHPIIEFFVALAGQVSFILSKSIFRLALLAQINFSFNKRLHRVTPSDDSPQAFMPSTRKVKPLKASGRYHARLMPNIHSNANNQARNLDASTCPRQLSYKVFPQALNPSLNHSNPIVTSPLTLA